jgi:hypothetical protein
VPRSITRRPLASAHKCDVVPEDEQADGRVSTRCSVKNDDGSVKSCVMVDETEDSTKKTRCMIRGGKVVWKVRPHSECADVMGRSQ